MREIVKKFGDFTANDHINLLVHKGEVHAILGENGAGKSTLMNVLYGLYQPTSGQIFVGGKEEVIHSPSRAIELGIGMVHQHFMLVQPFSVTENIILGMEPMKGLTVDLKTARKRVEEISKRYNMQVDPDAKIEDISVGMQQRVEILKVLYCLLYTSTFIWFRRLCRQQKRENIRIMLVLFSVRMHFMDSMSQRQSLSAMSF